MNVETRTLVLDLSLPDAAERLATATGDLDVGLLIYNAGADPNAVPLLDQSISDLRALVQRNCSTVLEACHHFGGRLLARARGGVVLVSSYGAWAGGSHVAAYGATKAFDLVLAESLWAEWRDGGVDVLALVLGATATPSLERLLDRLGGDLGELADPGAVAREALEHLADGPTWTYGMPDPTGASPVGTLHRRQAVELMSLGSAAMRNRAPNG